MLQKDDNGKAGLHHSSASNEVNAESSKATVKSDNPPEDSIPYDLFTPMALQMAVSAAEAKS